MEELIIEDLKSYDDLEYADDCSVEVEVFYKNKHYAMAKVYKDAEEEGREYICINDTIIYLDTIKGYLIP